MKSHIGKKIFDEFIVNTEEYRALGGDATKEQEMKDDAYEQWCAFLLIQNSNQSKYGSLVKGLISQYSMGNDQHPKTITAATDILLNHCFDNRSDKNCNRQTIRILQLKKKLPPKHPPRLASHRRMLIPSVVVVVKRDMLVLIVIRRT